MTQSRMFELDIAIDRNLPSASGSRKKGAITSPVLALLAALLILSVIAVTATQSNPSPTTGGNDQPTKTLAPGVPYFVIGYTRDSVGNLLSNCKVNITDKSTGDWDNSTLSDASGYYRFDLNSLTSGYDVGDTVNATAYYAGSIGWNETTVPNAPHLWLNVTIIGFVIPEFANIIIPIIGMLFLFAVVRVTSNRNQRKEL